MMHKPSLLSRAAILGGAIAVLSACGGDKPAADAAADGAASSDAPAAVASVGEQKYAQVCAACHMADGMGTPGVFPPLVGSDWLNGDPSVPISIVLHGLHGPITVNGDSYEGVMQPWGMIPDQDIAAILTYARSSWGNSASAVTAEQVTAIRSSAGARGAWTAEELRAAYPAP